MFLRFVFVFTTKKKFNGYLFIKIYLASQFTQQVQVSWKDSINLIFVLLSKLLPRLSASNWNRNCFFASFLWIISGFILTGQQYDRPQYRFTAISKSDLNWIAWFWEIEVNFLVLCHLTLTRAEEMPAQTHQNDSFFYLQHSDKKAHNVWPKSVRC